MVNVIDPCDPYMTFEVKLLITFVATDLLVIVTKFNGNPMKDVEEKSNCEKEERRKKELDMLPSQTA